MSAPPVIGAIPALATFAPLLLLARSYGEGWRIAFLLAATLWGLAVVAITELSSAGCQFSFGPVVATWSVTLAATCLYLARRLRLRSRADRPRGHGRSSALVAVVALLLLVVGLVGVVAWFGAPNSWDSHTYHLARVQHWLQNRTVAHYPTNIERQVESGPWAEFVLAHLFLLTGSDRLVNFVQWFAFVGSAVGVSVIARRLGARPIGQAAASAFCVSLPMAILQGSSTQNDLVLSFWLTTFVAFGLETITSRRGQEWLLVSAAASALGLGTLTKATMYVYAPAFALWFGIVLYKRHGTRRTLALAGLAAAIVLLINAPHFGRNMLASGAPLGPGYVRWNGLQIPYRNDNVTIATPISNVIRSLALQLGAPDVDRLFGHEGIDRVMGALAHEVGMPSNERWNASLVDATESLLRTLGIDPHDPSTTWDARQFRVPASGWNFEDTAGNPIQTILAATLLLWLLVSPAARTPLLLPYVGSCLIGLFLFNSVFAWQVYHSRLHLPLFVLIAAACGTVLDRTFSERRTACIATALLALSLPWALNNVTRPLLGRESVLVTPRFTQYFQLYPNLREQFLRAAERLKSTACRDIAIVIDNDAWEYPLWRALEEEKWPARIVHTRVENYSAKVPEPCCRSSAPPPCADVRITMTSVTVSELPTPAAPAAALPPS